MTLSELKTRVDAAIELATQEGADPAQIPITIQIDQQVDGSIWSTENVELFYDGGAECTGCLLSAYVPEEQPPIPPPKIPAMPPHLRPGPMASGIARGLSYEDHKREFYGELENLKTLIREEVLDEIYNQHGQNTELIERVRAAVSPQNSKLSQPQPE